MTVECNNCKKQIELKATSEINPKTGKNKWDRLNPDGTAHNCYKPREPIMTKEQGDRIITLLEKIAQK